MNPGTVLQMHGTLQMLIAHGKPHVGFAVH